MAWVAPTWLMVKRHRITGMKYLCKTNYHDPYEYLGSGKYWRRHLRIHGETVETIWAMRFDDEETIVEFATFVSEVEDVVHAKDSVGRKVWANLVPENGLDGGDRYQGKSWREISTTEVYEERVRKLKERNAVNLQTPEARDLHGRRVKETQWDTPAGLIRRQNLSKKSTGASNHQAKTYRMITPDGEFEVTALKPWCKACGLIYGTVKRAVGKGKIQRTGIKDTSFFYSKTKQFLEGWEIIEITGDKE